jgi:hypothetical protein
MLSPSSIRRTRIRSCSGVNDVVAIALHLLGAIWANGSSVRGCSARSPLDRFPRKAPPINSGKGLVLKLFEGNV